MIERLVALALSGLLASCAATPVTKAEQAEPERVVFMPISVQWAPLFPDERAKLRDAIISHLLSQPELQGKSFVPPAEVDAVEAAVRAGQRKVDGPVCGHPPSAYDAIDDRFGRGTLRVSTSVYCPRAGCRLKVTLTRPPPKTGAWSVQQEWKSPVESAFPAGEWLKAVANLKAQGPPNRAGLIFGSGGLGMRVKPKRGLKIEYVDGYGPWNVMPNKQTLAPIQEALDACHITGTTWSQVHHAVVEFDASGHASRVYFDAELGPRYTRCVEAALSSVDAGASAGGRRLLAGITNQAISGVTLEDGRKLHVYQHDFEYPPGFAPQGIFRAESRLARCFIERGALEESTFRAELSVGGDGQIAAASLSDLEGSDALRSCLESAYRATALSCTPDGQPATFSLSAKVEARAAN